MADQYIEVRRKKIENWRERQVAYPGRFEKPMSCQEVRSLDDDTIDVSVAGRLISLRVMGKLAFANIQDHSGKLQIALKVDNLGKDDFKFVTKNLDLGDHVGVSGTMFTTQKGEKTLRVDKIMLLSKGLRPLPEKFHGIQDPELKSRFRYLDLIANEDTRKRFETRHKVVQSIRSYLVENKFIEVETPVLTSASCGASARPFITHHNALDIELFLRIAPETYLKRLIAGGYDRVFEIAKCFRNEGIDPSHLQEFTMLEFYAAYWDYRNNMEFIQNMIQKTVQEVLGTSIIEFQGEKIDFSGEWPEYKYRDLVLEHAGIDLDEANSLEKLQAAIKEQGHDIPLDKYVGYGALVDALYKKTCRPKLIQPCFLTMHPQELVPLARKSDDDPRKLDMFQVLVNGWEIVKAYSELVDPIEQRSRLEEQSELAKAGDDEAMMMEEDFVLAMEYGMPPISGLGLGIDRFVSLITDSPNIRDVIYFPSMRPPSAQEVEVDEDQE